MGSQKLQNYKSMKRNLVHFYYCFISVLLLGAFSNNDLQASYPNEVRQEGDSYIWRIDGVDRGTTSSFTEALNNVIWSNVAPVEGREIHVLCSGALTSSISMANGQKWFFHGNTLTRSNNDTQMINARNVNNIEIHDLIVNGGGTYGIRLTASNNIVVNNVAVSNAHIGIRIDSRASNPWEARIHNVTVTNCRFENTGSHGLETYGVVGIHVDNIIARNTGGSGVQFNATSNGTVGTVDAYRCSYLGGYAGMRFANGSHDMVADTLFARECGRGLFVLSDSYNITVKYVEAIDCLDQWGAGRGVWLQNVTNVRVESGCSNTGWNVSGAGTYANLSKYCSDADKPVTYKIKNAETGMYLNGMGRTANGSLCGQTVYGTGLNAQWEMERIAGGAFGFRNRVTGLFLDAMGGDGFGNGSNCGQWSGSGHVNQQWDTIRINDQIISLRNIGTGFFLDGMGRTNNGDNVGMWEDDSRESAKWELIGVPPAPPTGLSMNYIKHNGVSLSWIGLETNGGYGVYIDGELGYSTTETTAVIDGLIFNTTYLITVRALDVAGNVSEDSEALEITTLPDPGIDDEEPPTSPTGLTVVEKTDTSISLTWDESTDNIYVEVYEVYVDDRLEIITNSNSATISSLVQGTEYSIIVVAVDPSGNSSESELFTVMTVDIEAPTTPTDLIAEFSETTILMSWAASTDNVGVVGYRIYVNNTLVETITITSYDLSEFKDLTSFTFGVSAVDAAGNESGRASLIVSNEPPSLMNHYEFEGNLRDSKGTKHGTAFGSPTYSDGVIGRGINFSGVNDYAKLPNGIVTYSQLTIATWVYWNGGGDWQRIFDFGDNTSKYMFLTPKTGNFLRFAIRTEDVDEQILNGPSLPVGEWKHVAVTMEGETARLYVDGFMVAENTEMTLLPNYLGVTQNNLIGRSQFPDPYLNGQLDDFRIYNYALSSEEINALIAEASEGNGTSISNLYSGNHDVAIYPNPSSGKFTLELTDFNPGEINISVYDIKGRFILHKKTDLSGGIKSVDCDFKGLESGLYYLKVSDNVRMETLKIMVKR
ncbi:Por secretion system C-terminal sorting domain-containing protein [Alkalitalea saponilacus]|uniref:Por secretion system C-terminal sorting domain-containing protein n=2 Tax=Alkalitalea saponilacus TaxID=889453 RepID=A0A1T5C8T6_9BACT|nr:Por secretion system C-terminal sorting domain-containing protein [Alkalitalea saponilacus]